MKPNVFRVGYVRIVPGAVTEAPTAASKQLIRRTLEWRKTYHRRPTEGPREFAH